MMRKILLAAGAVAAIGTGVLAGLGGPAGIPQRAAHDPDDGKAIQREKAIVDLDCSVSTDPGTRTIPAECPQQYAALMDLRQKGWCLGSDADQGQSSRWVRCSGDLPRQSTAPALGNGL